MQVLIIIRLIYTSDKCINLLPIKIEKTIQGISDAREKTRPIVVGGGGNTTNVIICTGIKKNNTIIIIDIFAAV